MDIQATQNNEEKKPLRNPFTMINISEEAAKLIKNPEERIYIVLYYNTEYEEYKCAEFTGRYNTYFGIQNILESESVDIRASKVLVELVGLDPFKGNKPRRYLMHPDEASSILEFCHSVENLFGDNAYSIDQYDTGPSIESREENTVSYPITLVSDPSISANQNRYIPGSNDGIPINTPQGDFIFYAGGGGSLGNGGNGSTDKPTKYFVPANMDDNIEGKEI